MPPLTQSLASYRLDSQRLLGDKAATLYDTVDLNAWVNRAIGQRDIDLRINRVIYRLAFTASTFAYTFAAITGGTLLTGNATTNPVDIYSITVVPIGGPTGGVRYPLGRYPYSAVAYLLSTSYPTYPVIYAMFGPNVAMVAPPPAAAYTVEWDLFGYGPQLVNDTDVDPIPYPWTDPVPFLVASFAKQRAQRFDEAKEYEQRYYQRLRQLSTGARPVAVSNPWASMAFMRR